MYISSRCSQRCLSPSGSIPSIGGTSSLPFFAFGEFLLFRLLALSSSIAAAISGLSSPLYHTSSSSPGSIGWRNERKGDDRTPIKWVVVSKRERSRLGARGRGACRADYKQLYSALRTDFLTACLAKQEGLFNPSKLGQADSALLQRHREAEPDREEKKIVTGPSGGRRTVFTQQ